MRASDGNRPWEGEAEAAAIAGHAARRPNTCAPLQAEVAAAELESGVDQRTVPSPIPEAHGGDLSAADVGLCVVYSTCANLGPGYVLARGERAVIGRQPDCQIALANDSGASRNHAQLEWHGDILVVRDLGSTNGTWVNGQRVERAALRPHAILRVGGTVFTIGSAQAANTARAASPAGSTLIGGTWLDALRDQLARIARSELSVVVQGESGTGKEPVARELHALSGRTGRFVPVNCTALPAALIESELFGYKKGAFSGANADKHGLVRAADGGTLFLDEIGDMPLEAQAKLLRVLQEREVLPLGATRAEPVDLRVVCATHRELESAVEHGTFRGDLMARVRQFAVKLLPLRERKADLLPLITHFLRELGRPELSPTLDFMHALAVYDFPYNVRELKSAIHVAAALATGRELLVQHLPENMRSVLPSQPQPDAAHSSMPPPDARKPSSPPPDEETLRALLHKHGGNISAISRELHKDRVQIHRWLRRYGIDPDDARNGA